MRAKAIDRVKAFIRKTIELSGYTVEKIHTERYDQDGLRSIHNHDFMLDPSFRKAYERGVWAAKEDYQWHWSLHRIVGCLLSQQAHRRFRRVRCESGLFKFCHYGVPELGFA